MIKYLLFCLFLFSGIAHSQVVFHAPKVSSGTFGQVTVGSGTVEAVPPRRFNCRANVTFTNNSSSDSVFMAPAMSTMAAAVLRSTGTPVFSRSQVSVDTDPLSANLTFYFLAPAGSTGVDLRWFELGCSGGFQSP